MILRGLLCVPEMIRAQTCEGFVRVVGRASLRLPTGWQVDIAALVNRGGALRLKGRETLCNAV